MEQSRIVNVAYVPFSESYSHPGSLEETKSLHFATGPLPSYIIKNDRVKKYLSDAQLDSVALACEAFQTILPSGYRQGFFIGDGAGVGKNRQVLGILAEIMFTTSTVQSKPHRPKALFITCSNALFEQTNKDIKNLGVEYPLFLLANRNDFVDIDKNHGVMFATYSLLTGIKSDSRMTQIIDWLTRDFEGMIIFDESHMAKRYSDDIAETTKAGKAVVKLQEVFPLARVLYSSATGLSSISHVGYLQRLGLYGLGTPYVSSLQFIEFAKLRGVSAMELMIVELRRKGVYIARTLSVKGLSFEKVSCKIDKTIYNHSTQIWALIYQYIKCKEVAGQIISQYWQAHQRFFAALILSCKIDPTVDRTRFEVQAGNSVVLGIQSTGEARLRAVKDYICEGETFSAAKEILLDIMKNLADIDISDVEMIDENLTDDDLQYYKNINDDDDEEKLFEWVENAWDFLPPQNVFKKIDDKQFKKIKLMEHLDFADNVKVERDRIHARNTYLVQIKASIIREFHVVASMFAVNPLDALLEKLGGDNKVAEMTGRTFKREKNADGDYDTYHRSAGSESINDYKEFMSGNKKVAIISEAFSTGVSLHNEKKASGIRGGARVHITLEYSWSADRVIQQFGRTHRSNQSEPPKYVLMVSNVPGEERFLASITEKLQLLGALTRGDKSANTMAAKISELNFNPEIWKVGIMDYCETLQKNCVDVRRDAITLKVLEILGVVKKSGEKYSVNTLSKNNTKFMNRLLGLPIQIQERVLDGITSAIEDYVWKLNCLDKGIADYPMGPGMSSVIIEKRDICIGNGNSLKMYKIEIDKSMSWAAIAALLDQYEHEMLISNCGPVVAFPSQNDTFLIYKPFDCVKEKIFSFEKRSYKPAALIGDFKKNWTSQFRKMKQNVNMCAHEQINGVCYYRGCNKKFKAVYQICLISGPLFLVWEDIQRVIGGSTPLQAYRMQTKEEKNKVNLVGIVIPLNKVSALKKKFAEKTMESTTDESNDSETIDSDTSDSD